MGKPVSERIEVENCFTKKFEGNQPASEGKGIVNQASEAFNGNLAVSFGKMICGSGDIVKRLGSTEAMVRQFDKVTDILV